MDEKPAPSGLDNVYLRVIDSALLVAIALAVLQYAGWTYRQAYLKRFSIDPSGLDSSSVAVGVEGLGAIMTTFAAWAIASMSLFVLAVCTWFFIRWVERRRGRNEPVLDRTAINMILAGGIAIAIAIVLASGSIAGRRAAEDRIENVRRGETWTYHLDQGAIAGVLIVQTKDTTWILTKDGVRLVRTQDIRSINGPLLDGLLANRQT
jgi:ABC-type Fe3+ transport system permease subunit